VLCAASGYIAIEVIALLIARLVDGFAIDRRWLTGNSSTWSSSQLGLW
jgi:hypothetical protein